MRHKWNGKPSGSSSSYRVGLAVACVRCDCVKEIIGGRVTYFINDNVYEKSPPCISMTPQPQSSHAD